MKTFEPLKGNVFVRYIQPKIESSIVLLPQIRDEGSDDNTTLSQIDDTKLARVEFAHPSDPFKVGDEVILDKYDVNLVQIGTKKYAHIKVDQIKAKINK